VKGTDLYHPLILKHNKNPLHFKVDNDGDKINAYNPICGDEFQIVISIENNKINKASFHGYGCAVSKSALDLLLDRIQNLDIPEAVAEIEKYLRVMDLDDPPSSDVYSLAVFQKVKFHPARRECATLGANAILRHLRERLV